MRLGYALGSSISAPSLGTAPALLVFDLPTRSFSVHDNPGTQIPPRHGQRPAAVHALAQLGVDTLVVRPGALCPESYTLALKHGMRFVLWQDVGGPDAAMLALSPTATVATLPEAFYSEIPPAEGEV